jgi:hypothetical protein
LEPHCSLHGQRAVPPRSVDSTLTVESTLPAANCVGLSVESRASISLLDGGTAPVRVHVMADAATAYATARASTGWSIGRDDCGPKAASSTRAAMKAAPNLIPTLETQVERGGPIACGALALAAWARYLATVPPTLRAPDSLGERTAALAHDSLVKPIAFLDLDDVFTPSLRESARFHDAFAAAAADLARLGPRGAIEQVSS